MRNLVDSTDRGPIDFFHFAAVFFGLLLFAAGVIMTTSGIAILGAILVTLGIAYFLVQG